MPAMREGFTPPSEDDETSKAPKTDGPSRREADEAKRAKGKAQEKRAQNQDRERREEKQQASARQPEIREEAEKEKAARPKEQPFVVKASPEIPYKDAKEAVEVISAIQDEKKVVVSHGELVKFKKLLVKYGGLDQKVVDKMDVAEIIVVVQSVLRNAKPIQLQAADFKHVAEKIQGTKTHLAVDKAYFRRLIAKVQSMDEELLTAEKVAKYLTVEEKLVVGEEPEMGGPGAMQVSPQTFFRQLIQEQWAILKQGNQGNARWQQIEQDLAQLSQSVDVGIILPTARAWQEISGSLPIDPALRQQMENELNIIFPQNLRQTLQNTLSQKNAHYEDLLEKLGPKGEKADLGDIAQEANRYLKALKYGNVDPEDLEKGLLSVANVHLEKEKPGYEGIRVWYAYQELERLLISQQIIDRSEIKTDPLENIKAAHETMQFFEKSGTLEGFGLAQQRLTLLLEAVEASPHVSDQVKDKLRRHIEAFNVLTPIFIINIKSEGLPERLQQRIHETFENTTIFDFLDRFSELRDENGKLYLVDANGNELPLNLENEALNAFIYQYLFDRFRKNQVEDMQKRGLNHNAAAGSEEAWIIERIRQILQQKGMSHAAADIDRVWQVGGKWDKLAKWQSDEPELQKIKETAIQDWFQEKTFIGADGFDANGNRRVDLTREEIVQTILRNKLLAAGVDPNRVNALLGDPNNPAVRGNYELAQAIARDADNLAMFYMADGVDRLQIFSYNGEQINSLFGERTPYWARNVSHIEDYMLQEGHGDARVNKIFREKLREKFGTFMLPQLQTMVRLMGIDGVLPPNLKHYIDQEIEREIQRTGLPRDEVEFYVRARELFKGYNPNAAPGTQQLELFNIDWTEASKQIKSFEMGDIYDDRTAAFKFFMEELKEFTFRPFDAEVFFRMMNKYYSMRHIRKRPAAEFFLEVYWECGKYWKEWFDYEENITSAQMETVVQTAIEQNIIEKPRGERVKTKLLGRPLFRTTKQAAAFAFWAVKSVLKPGYIAGRIFDFFKTLLDYIVSGFR